MSRQEFPPEYLAKMPVNAYARRLIFWLFARYCLNSERYVLRRRFTGPRPNVGQRAHTLKKDATAYRYYLDTRPSVMRQLWRLQHGTA